MSTLTLDDTEGLELTEMVVKDWAKETVLGELLDRAFRRVKEKEEMKKTAGGSKSKDELDGETSKKNVPVEENQESETSSLSSGSTYSEDDADNPALRATRKSAALDRIRREILVDPDDPRFAQMTIAQQYLDAAGKGDVELTKELLATLYLRQAREGNLCGPPGSLSTIASVEEEEVEDEEHILAPGVPLPPGLNRPPTLNEVKFALRNRIMRTNAAVQAATTEYHAPRGRQTAGNESLPTSANEPPPPKPMPLGPNARAGYDGVKHVMEKAVQTLAAVSTFFTTNEEVAEYTWSAWALYEATEALGVLLLWLELALIGCWVVIKYNPRTFLILTIVLIFCKKHGIAIDEVLFGILEDLAMKGKIVLGRGGEN